LRPDLHLARFLSGYPAVELKSCVRGIVASAGVVLMENVKTMITHEGPGIASFFPNFFQMFSVLRRTQRGRCKVGTRRKSFDDE
jgi:hypothetical protein